MKSCVASVNSKSPDTVQAQLLISLERLVSGVCNLDEAFSQPGLLIALSGGLDSIVLLSIAARWQLDKAQKDHKPKLRAVYVDHGLQSQSAAWGEHCAALCKTLNVEFSVQKVVVDLDSDLSPEAAARDARYQAFESLLAANELLCTAHHADDQIETLLMQLMRGAGVQGLGGMPPFRKFAASYLLRPLLDLSREQLLRYARDNGLDWCEDPSNSDTRYDRNFIRHEVMPSIKTRWPGASASVSRSASHCREAVALLNDLALLDLGMLDPGMPDVGAPDYSAQSVLSVDRLKPLSLVRCKNALRYWIVSNGYQAPSQSQLEQVLTDLVHAHNESHGRISFGQAQIARYRHQLYVAARGTFDPVPDFEYQWNDCSQPLFIREANWQLSAQNRPRLLAGYGTTLTVRNRRGGERWRSANGNHSTSVKSLLQQRHIPPWERCRLALVFSGEVLVDICGPNFHLE